MMFALIARELCKQTNVFFREGALPGNYVTNLHGLVFKRVQTSASVVQ
jgi:hypothetical protein